ncbi:hypothetical protein, unknown function [Leishmania tarentolae]|uniref:Uncharacterized protein n=1 Tax=Leishmania tarentolae TaxID=5689 RepID=A0A640KSS3_LEITA|nr:hypothetical protein, unknown function [Leishmania tarentolae]
MSSITDRVIAYRDPQDGKEAEVYGLCLRREGNTLRVMLLQEEDDYERPLRAVLRKLSAEDAIVDELENRLQSLQSNLSDDSDAARQKKCRLQKILLQSSTRRLEGVEEREWTLLSQQHHPSPVVSSVGCTVVAIAAGKSLTSSTWADAQRLLRSGKEMVRQLRQASEQRMDRSLYDSIKEVSLFDVTVSYSSVLQESPSLGILHKWITAFMDYQRVCYMEDGDAELQRQMTGCQNSLQSARERRTSLAKQSDLIKKGNCYRRTQTVRSIPIEHVLYLMTSEKVTTRQYLLKERVPLESLEEVLAKSVAGPQSACGSPGEEQARMGTLSFPRVEHPVSEARSTDPVPTGVSTHPFPKAGPVRREMWVNGSHVRRPHTSTDDSGNMDTAENGSAAVVSSTDLLKEHTDKAHIPRGLKRAFLENSRSPPSGDKAAVAGAMTTTAATSSVSAPISLITQAGRQNGTSFPSREPSTASASADAQNVLADVKNHFKSVQETLLACLEEYEELEEKYSNTVEQSKQLLQTLKERDDEIARLREDLSQATQKQLFTGRAVSSLQQNQLGASSSDRYNGYQMPRDEAQLQYTPTTSACNSGSFTREVEYLLEDTLDFVRGAAAAPVV